ncbi:MAG: ATP-binding protein [Proteobacteria bacterium]|nr:ATP-binding protein [Pseudomonadota bacterium]
MNPFRRLKGPRLGTKLMLLGMLLLVVPWFSYRQLVEMERLLIQGQSHAQLLTAEGISTLFNGREDLFNDLPVAVQDYESLFAHPLQSAIRLDAKFEDWGGQLDNKVLSFGSVTGDTDGDFRVLLGERGGQLYVFMWINDPEPVYRKLDLLRLDSADQIRLSFIRTDGEDGRISLIPTEPGVATAYEMDADWRFAKGTPENRVQAVLVQTEKGWQAEFRLPLDMLGSSRYFGMAFVDVDDPEARTIANNTQTLPKAGKESFNLVVLRSPEVLNIVKGLGYSGARIMVIDAQKQVRAETGAEQTSTTSPDVDSWFDTPLEVFHFLRPYLHELTTGETWVSGSRPEDSTAIADRTIASSLNGEPIAVRREIDNDQEIIMAAHPIVSEDRILGTVVVEQNINEIMTFQRSAIEQVVLFSVASLFTVFIALLAFAGRLAWRIRNLRREASAAIDQYGRLRTNELSNEINSGDEIGDLARSVSNMLSKLHQHNTFLENMPRTLRHEINNPLNTLNTSLENLATENPEIEGSKYLESAKRGVIRIGSIVQNLADAANLEESLAAEELEVIDIHLLLRSYVNNCSITHKKCSFVYKGPDFPVYAAVSDFRIEQMLDKIVDNAIDFHRTNSPIKVQLDTNRDYLQITVANRGPTLPEEDRRSLFDSMVSHRGSHNRLHFGLGLYVVRVIAEHHAGFVRAFNLADNSGVAIMVQLPLAEGINDQRSGYADEETSATPPIAQTG